MAFDLNDRNTIDNDRRCAHANIISRLGEIACEGAIPHQVPFGIGTSYIIGAVESYDVFAIRSGCRGGIRARWMAEGSAARDELLLPILLSGILVVTEQADSALFHPITRGGDDLIAHDDSSSDAAARDGDFPSDIRSAFSIELIGKLGLRWSTADIGSTELRPVFCIACRFEHRRAGADGHDGTEREDSFDGR